MLSLHSSSRSLVVNEQMKTCVQDKNERHNVRDATKTTYLIFGIAARTVPANQIVRCRYGFLVGQIALHRDVAKAELPNGCFIRVAIRACRIGHFPLQIERSGRRIDPTVVIHNDIELDGVVYNFVTETQYRESSFVGVPLFCGGAVDPKARARHGVWLNDPINAGERQVGATNFVAALCFVNLAKGDAILALLWIANSPEIVTRLVRLDFDTDRIVTIGELFCVLTLGQGGRHEEEREEAAEKYHGCLLASANRFLCF